jgi:hypothetical protein
MKFQYFAALVLTQLHATAAFSPNGIASITSTSTSTTRTSLNAIPSPEASAKAFTDYMAKSHTEKIKALKALEDAKNAEIAALKAQITSATAAASASASSPAPPQAALVLASASGPAGSTSTEELTKKIESYQKFIAEYIVKAQQDKAAAVKEAEAAIAKKYEDKLNAFMLPEASASSSTASASTNVNVESKLYQERNANIAAAAKAGKSRWGDMEVARAGASPPPSKLISAIPAIPVAAGDARVVEADHGLRADGGVGGLTLAQRVASGSAAAAAAAVEAEAVSASNPNFEKRNAFIAAAAKAGKQSRWGSFEENRAIAYVSNALPPRSSSSSDKKIVVVVLPEVQAADHGLRADGGVGGPSLAERVNLGARLLQ